MLASTLNSSRKDGQVAQHRMQKECEIYYEFTTVRCFCSLGGLTRELLNLRYRTDSKDYGGEGGIRTPGTGFGPYNGLANRRLQPLGHLSDVCFQ